MRQVKDENRGMFMKDQHHEYSDSTLKSKIWVLLDAGNIHVSVNKCAGASICS
jgi:hypothetical protein